MHAAAPERLQMRLQLQMQLQKKMHDAAVGGVAVPKTSAFDFALLAVDLRPFLRLGTLLHTSRPAHHSY